MTAEDRELLICEIRQALHAEMPQLTEEEQHWVRMAIQKEAQSIEFRKAIIEKTLGGLIWSAIVGFGYILLDFLKNHGLRV